jgi:hypothetical protein
MTKRQNIGMFFVVLALTLLCGCSTPAPPPAPVYCHQWTEEEKQGQYRDDLALSHDNALRPIIKDYLRVCRALKP